jgi:ribosomal protein S15P/S13E
MNRVEKMNLTALEREQLLSATRSHTVRAADARRARLILMLDDGESREAIMQRLRCDSRFISRWSHRQNHAMPYQRAVRRLSHRCDRQPAAQASNSCDLRQRQQAQNRTCAEVSTATSQRAIALHTDLSSRLNQVENWFARIQRDVIARGILTTVKDLNRKLMRYIREHNKNPKPIKWKYDDSSRRIRPVPFQ